MGSVARHSLWRITARSDVQQGESRHEVTCNYGLVHYLGVGDEFQKLGVALESR